MSTLRSQTHSIHDTTTLFGMLQRSVPIVGKNCQRYKIERAIRVALDLQKRGKRDIKAIAAPDGAWTSWINKEDRVLEMAKHENVALRNGAPMMEDEQILDELDQAGLAAMLLPQPQNEFE